MNLEIGATVGDYQVVGILGAGGMGQVYKVRNVISDRVEAMKVLLPDLVNQPDLADRFLREIKVQASLEHPNIAALHTAVRVDNQLLMLMEFVEGVTLDQKLKNGPLPPANAVDHIMQVLAALEYAHARGVVHRDIKPANMMLTPSGAMKLMDFGIARSSADHKLTQTGTTVGSLYYMSPEQIQGVVAPDARSDIYSVGVSLYELVTGKRPFDGDSQFAIMSAHLAGTPVPPVKVDPRLPQSLNDVILMSVAKDASARFQTAGAVRNALSRVAAELRPASATAATITAAPINRPAPAAQPAKSAKPASRRGLWMGLGAVAAVAVIVAAVSIAPWKGKGAAPANVPAPAAQAPAVEAPAPVAAQPSQPEPQPLPSTPAPAPVSEPVSKSQRAPARPGNAAQAVPAASQPVVQAPAPMSTPQSPAPQPAAAQQPPQQPAATGPSRAELQQVREHLALLGVRASGIRTSLDSLQRSQAAGGMSLRGDMQQAATLMTTYLEGADAALNAGDVVQSRSFADKAERQVEKLEKFFNR
uniref:non-specific serine/threonine protein kinase n=1 Tax=Solibacter usitatus (strain Ellin6076) TaxID=234267 RepID=Q02CI1_SOLUE